MAQLSYNTAEVTPEAPRGLWPNGKYRVELTGADVKPTNSGTGEYIEVEFTAIDAPLAGRKIWSRFNVSNTSAEAQRIGRAQFSACHIAAGLKVVADTDQLLGRTLVIEVGTGKRKDTGADQNVIYGYFSATGVPPANAPAAPAPSAPGAAAPAAPWEKAKASA